MHNYKSAQKLHRSQSIFLFASMSLLTVAMLYLALVRPFSVGFDLNSVEEGRRLQVFDAVDDSYTSLNNRLLGLRAQVLSGEFKGTELTANSISQLDGIEQPFVMELNANGPAGEILAVGLARPGENREVYEFPAGLTADNTRERLDSENLMINVDEGTAEARGKTYVESEDSIIKADEGLFIDREGNIEIR